MAQIGVSIVALVLLLCAPGANAAPPPNDNYADSQEIAGLPGEATGSTVDATREPGEPDHTKNGNNQRSIWFKWTAPRSAGVTPTTNGCSPPFTDSQPNGAVMVVYARSEVFGLVEVRAPFRAEAGRTYWIAVESPASAAADPDICVRLLPAPANDDFANATPLDGFPVVVTEGTQGDPTDAADRGGATVESGEPSHGAEPTSASVWYTWRAPSDGPVLLRLCAPYESLAAYTGDQPEALTRVASAQSRQRGCGGETGGGAVLNAVAGTIYRLAVGSNTNTTSPPEFTLMIGNELTVVGGPNPFLSYRAFAGEADDVDVRLVGAGSDRTFLVAARGLSVAIGCRPELAVGTLRCPVPGKARPRLDIDLGDGDDKAQVRVRSEVAPDFDGTSVWTVAGGLGDDVLLGAGRNRLALSGGAGADEVRGGRGTQTLRGAAGDDVLEGGASDDLLYGGTGSDRITPGSGRDTAYGSPGSDLVRTRDGATDIIACGGGADLARVDGFDLPRRCERRSVHGLPRTVATAAFVANDDGESDEHLLVGVTCPIDATRGCRSRVRVGVPGQRLGIARRVRLRRGRGDVLVFFRLSEDRLARRGVRVTITTERTRGGPLRSAARLPVVDERYFGE